MEYRQKHTATKAVLATRLMLGDLLRAVGLPAHSRACDCSITGMGLKLGAVTSLKLTGVSSKN
jgi:hypothetical protein